jgi:glycine betaine/proline transport system substrate-binding protein
VSTVVTGTEYAPAVPGDVAKKLHVHSLADLAKHADAFDRKIYGIEAGSPGNETIQKAIDANAYGLGDWKLVASGTPAMLAQVEKSEKAGQPIVFLGWSPHWMTVQFHTVFLADPKKVWGGAGEIRTLTRAGFAKDNPDIDTFIKNLEFSTDEAGQFYYAHDKQGRDIASIAADWIKKNPAKVKAFLQGVDSADGKPATEVFSS